MAKRQIQTQFVGSLLGFFWTFINPLVMIFIFWFVFGFGLKARPLGDIPFAVWLAGGMAIWTAFSEIVIGSANIIVENQALIKKTRILAHVLPLSKIVASVIPHLIFLLILIVLMLFYELPFKIYFFQFLYYFFAMSIFALGVGWLVASLNVFIRDTAPMVNVVMQFLFWLTPIMWDINIMPTEFHKFLKLNPLFYLVQGYRDSFFYFVPFWNKWDISLYYWIITIILFITGGLVFKKTRPHFADLL